MLYDFHTHTFLSDGILSPIELIRYAVVQDYAVLGITDHAGTGTLPRTIAEVSADCSLARAHWKILAFPGIELTHVPAAAIDGTARRARELGARLVVVHGETTGEPVEKGTNLAAVRSRYVDILAHPGWLKEEEAELAARNGVFLELSGRRGHDSTNAHVAGMARKAGARLLVNSDAHADTDLLTRGGVEAIVRAAGFGGSEEHVILNDNPLLLLERLQKRETA